MTDFPSFPSDGDKRIVYVREIRSDELPEEVRAQAAGIDQLYSIHAPNGEVLALVSGRREAFAIARRNEFSPVSVH